MPESRGYLHLNEIYDDVYPDFYVLDQTIEEAMCDAAEAALGDAADRDPLLRALLVPGVPGLFHAWAEVEPTRLRRGMSVEWGSWRGVVTSVRVLGHDDWRSDGRTWRIGVENVSYIPGSPESRRVGAALLPLPGDFLVKDGEVVTARCPVPVDLASVVAQQSARPSASP